MGSKLHVAIVGGGLCGIALAIGLEVRGISYTIYESRGSFTEIGAGIAVGPTAVQSLRLIDPKLGEIVYNLSTRNPPPHEDVFMLLRYGAPSGVHADGEIVTEIKSTTGNMTLHRQEFLRALADEMGTAHARFNKKLIRYEQTADAVSLHFADGSTDNASILVGCDGIHSQVRAAMFPGPSNPLNRAQYFQEGVYRAVFPTTSLVDAIGPSACRSTIYYGPNGYFITYPISSGTAINCGAWVSRPDGAWNDDPELPWVVANQRAQLDTDYRDWGETVHRILKLFPTDVAFWAAHQHAYQPDSLRDGRVLIVGDAAHAMPPHQGSGAATALEDAYVLAEVLQDLQREKNTTITGITAAARAVEETRIPRSRQVHQYSRDAGFRWREFYQQKMEGAALEEWKAETKRRFDWIWGVDMADEAAKAKTRLAELLAASSGVQ